MDIERFLEDIEERLEPDEEEEVLAAWHTWAMHENTHPFSGCPRKPRKAGVEWQYININDALADDDLMVLSQFYNVHKALETGAGRTLYVRANYGVGNIATMFGAPLFVMDREADTLPNVRAIGPEKAAAFARGELVPDMKEGNGASILRMAERFQRIRERYPKIARFVRIEQPDLQGPMDNCELLWGSEIFYALYDEPDIIHALLKTVTRLIEDMADKWHELFPRTDGTCSYFTHVEKGGIAIRDDSAMNLSPEFFDEYIAPYDGYLLKKYGGVVHFCGRGDHFIGSLSKLEGLNGVNISQPHLNDMDKIFSATADRGINLSITAPEVDMTGHDRARILYW